MTSRSRCSSMAGYTGKVTQLKIGDEWLTVAEAAQKTGITQAALRNRIRQMRREGLDVDPEYLTDPRPMVWQFARLATKRGYWEWDEIAYVLRLPTPRAAQAYAMRVRQRLRDRHADMADDV